MMGRVRYVRVDLTLIVERKRLEEALGFHLDDREWSSPRTVAALILENPEVIPALDLESRAEIVSCPNCCSRRVAVKDGVARCMNASCRHRWNVYTGGRLK